MSRVVLHQLENICAQVFREHPDIRYHISRRVDQYYWWHIHLTAANYHGERWEWSWWFDDSQRSDGLGGDFLRTVADAIFAGRENLRDKLRTI